LGVDRLLLSHRKEWRRIQWIDHCTWVVVVVVVVVVVAHHGIHHGRIVVVHHHEIVRIPSLLRVRLHQNLNLLLNDLCAFGIVVPPFERGPSSEEGGLLSNLGGILQRQQSFVDLSGQGHITGGPFGPRRVLAQQLRFGRKEEEVLFPRLLGRHVAGAARFEFNERFQGLGLFDQFGGDVVVVVHVRAAIGCIASLSKSLSPLLS